MDAALADRPDGLEHVDLPGPDLVGVERDGRLHRDEAEELDEVVLDHVAERARGLVVAPTVLDPDRLGDGDLDVVDVAAVPDGLEEGVREPQREHVLDGLLAEVVVDPVDLALTRARLEALCERPRARQVPPERLLDDEPVVVLVGHEPGGAEPARDRADEERGDGEVEHAVRARPAGRACVEVRGQARVRLGLRRVALEVAQAAGERGPAVLVAGRRLPGRPGGEGPEGLVVHLLPVHADDLDVLGEVAVALERVEGREELPVREVAGGPEEDELDGRRERGHFRQEAVGGKRQNAGRPGMFTGCSGQRYPPAANASGETATSGTAARTRLSDVTRRTPSDSASTTYSAAYAESPRRAAVSSTARSSTARPRSTRDAANADAWAASTTVIRPARTYFSRLLLTSVAESGGAAHTGSRARAASAAVSVSSPRTDWTSRVVSLTITTGRGHCPGPPEPSG